MHPTGRVYSGGSKDLSRVSGQWKTSQLHASVAIKLSAIGALFDQQHCRENTLSILREAAKKHVAIEIDMEGIGLVDLTIGTASACVQEGYTLTLALQAYLDRTAKDLGRVISQGIGIRLVKGAYHGDTEDFMEIRERFRSLLLKGLSSGGMISVATHDLSIIDWIGNEMACEKSRLELGFLMGLSTGQKKISSGMAGRFPNMFPMVRDDGAYIARREYYLQHLESLGMAPAP